MYFSPSRKAFFVDAFGDDSIEISDEVYTATMNQVSQGQILEADADGNPITVAPVVPVLTLDEVLLSKQAMVIADYEQAATKLRGKYPVTETSTWILQLTQATVYKTWVDGGKVGDAPSVPFLEALNQARTNLDVGQGMDDLVAAIFDNNSKYAPAIASLTAQKQAADRDIQAAYAAGDVAALKAVTWTFTVGE